MQIRRAFALCVALAFVLGAAPSFAQARLDTSKQPKRSKLEQQDIDTLWRAVDAAGAGQAAPSDVTITWKANDFVKGQSGITYIPYTLNIDGTKLTSPKAAYYVRVVKKGEAAPVMPAAPDGKDKDKKAAPAVPTYPWSSIDFIEIPAQPTAQIQRAMQLPAGEYEVFIAVKDRATDAKNQIAKAGLFRRELTVPDFGAAELQTSSIILAQAVEPMTGTLKPEEQQQNPYVFGPMRITPSLDGKFGKAAELNVVFWIYGAAAAGTSGKPDVTVDYNFHQKLAEGEKYFNKTAPQLLNAETLPPQFSVAEGHQLPGSLVVPLASFPAGDYRLEIKVTDKPSGKTVTQNVNFTVAAS